MDIQVKFKCQNCRKTLSGYGFYALCYTDAQRFAALRRRRFFTKIFIEKLMFNITKNYHTENNVAFFAKPLLGVRAFHFLNVNQ